MRVKQYTMWMLRKLNLGLVKYYMIYVDCVWNVDLVNLSHDNWSFKNGLAQIHVFERFNFNFSGIFNFTWISSEPHKTKTAWVDLLFVRVFIWMASEQHKTKNSLSWFIDPTRFVLYYKLRQGYVTTTDLYKVGFYLYKNH